MMMMMMVMMMLTTTKMRRCRRRCSFGVDATHEHGIDNDARDEAMKSFYSSSSFQSGLELSRAVIEDLAFVCGGVRHVFPFLSLHFLVIFVGVNEKQEIRFN